VTHRVAYEIVEKLHSVRAQCQQQRVRIISELQADNKQAVRQLVIDIYDRIEANLEQAIAMARAIEADVDISQDRERGDSSHDTR
jgi:5'-3' exonuclease